MRNFIRRFRDERGLTQQELADSVGVSRQAIHAIERDKHDPSIRLAARIANTLSAAIEEIFDLEDVDRRS